MIHILQKVPDVCIAALFIIAATLVPAAGAPAAIDARDLVFRSAGTQDGSGGWNLASNSYVGTFIYLSKRAAVTISVRVAGHEAEMHVHVAQSTFVQHVNHEDFRTYTYALTLPPGTYCLRVELTNAGPKSAAGLKVRSLAVSGEGVRTRNRPLTGMPSMRRTPTLPTTEEGMPLSRWGLTAGSICRQAPSCA